MAKMSRRSFLLLSASAGAAMAAESGDKITRQLIPYVNPPQGQRPGVWSLYATTCRECPAGCGLHMRVIDGRPIKAEGNPDHYVNHGKLCARGQSSVQGLYDPDRLRFPQRGGAAVDWNTALTEVGGLLARSNGRVAVMSGIETGSLAELLDGFAQAFGSRRLLYHEPFNYEPVREAHDILFGLPVIPEYRIDRSTFLISFGVDFLETWVSPVQYARGFGALRNFIERRSGEFVYVGPRLSMTAANADHFFPVPPGAETAVARALLEAVVQSGGARGDIEGVRRVLGTLPKGPPPAGLSAGEIGALARRFAESEGSLALAGPVGAPGGAATQTALLAALLNYAVGSIGPVVDFSHVHALSRAATAEETRRFLDSLTKEDVLIVHNCNPVYARKEADAAIRRAGTVVCLSVMPDETAVLADWVLPIDSPLESWGDYAPWTGVEGLMQPLLARLHDTRPAGDILLALARNAGRPVAGEGSFQARVQRRWEPKGWRESQRRGGAMQAVETPRVALRGEAAGRRMAELFARAAAPAPTGSTPLWLASQIFLFDGRLANRGWMQEVPDPTSSVVWGSWVEMHPKKVLELGLAAGDLVELETASGSVQAPVRVTEDVAEQVVALPFGQGHAVMGRHAAGRGANAFRLLGAGPAPGPFGVVRLRKVGRAQPPIVPYATQEQHHRKILEWTTPAELEHPTPEPGREVVIPLPKEAYDPKRDVYPPHEYPKHRWAMVIDLARCIGCGACTAACYAENNVAVIGAEQMQNNRQMAWVRVVPYRDEENPHRLGFLPMLCQHCDAAPCEPVCPVFASVHNEEGLNAQVYNRCIGTRYCSNNCPYKVRRFNWFDWKWPEPLDRQLNPEVTVRPRGVMEKCTFCIQRIREVEYRAAREQRPVRDGEVAPACAQTCPTEALIFGDLMDAGARVTALMRGDPRRYQILQELNTKPGIMYLKRVKRAWQT